MANEKRLIDANKLKDRFKLRLDWLKKDVHDEYTKGLYHGCDYDMTLINEQILDAVDAVEVVRCKDCKHWLHDVAGCTDQVGRCECANYMVGASGYCVYGERITDD